MKNSNVLVSIVAGLLLPMCTFAGMIHKVHFAIVNTSNVPILVTEGLVDKEQYSVPAHSGPMVVYRYMAINFLKVAYQQNKTYFPLGCEFDSVALQQQYPLITQSIKVKIAEQNHQLSCLIAADA